MFSDFRFAFRSLLKTPGFTCIVVLTLALGIGANATVLCWIRNTLWRPIPGVTQAEQLVVITSNLGSSKYDTVSLPNIEDQRKLQAVFSGIIASQMTPVCATIDGNLEWGYAQITTANFFSTLGVRPIAGRFFLPSEDKSPGKDAVLVISEAYWKRRFGGDPSVIGRNIDVNRHAFTIIGIAPAEFHGTMSGLNYDFWAPLSMHNEVANFGSLANRSDHWLHTQARLQPGMSIEQAQAAMDALALQLETAYPDTNRQQRFRVLPLWKAPYGGQTVLLPVLSVLLAVSILVLLVVCVNVANLLLVRTLRRQKDIAIRLSLGASRGQIIRHLLSESLCFAILGGTLGTVFTLWSLGSLVHFFPKTHLPLGYGMKFDGIIFMLVLGITLATGLLVGLLPAWQASRMPLHDAMKDANRGSSGGSRHQHMKSLLVASETALALVLLVGAGLCVRGLKKAREIDTGISTDNALIAGMRIGMNGYNESSGKILYRKLQQRIAETPGVESAALASWFPLGFEGGSTHKIEVKGYVPAPNEGMSILSSIISRDYFGTMGITLLAGRDFSDRDDEKAPLVVIINEAMAKRFWPGQNAIGRTLRLHGYDRTVIGVTKTGKYRSLDEAPRDFLYTPYQQGVWDLNLGICLRAKGDPLAMVASLREAVHSIDPNVEIWTTQRMTDFCAAAYVAQKMASSLLLGLGSVALILSALGVYGVMAFVVSQRTQEFGIRMALGAQRFDILELVLKQGLKMTLIGIGVGIGLSLVVSRFLAGFLYGVSPFDLIVFILTPALLALVSLLACYLPAYRATHITPVEALRAD